MSAHPGIVVTNHAKQRYMEHNPGTLNPEQIIREEIIDANINNRKSKNKPREITHINRKTSHPSHRYMWNAEKTRVYVTRPATTTNPTIIITIITPKQSPELQKSVLQHLHDKNHLKPRPKHKH